MTKEELLHELDGIVPKNPKSDWSKYQRHIVDMAIKTLEQEPYEIIKEIPKDYCYDTETKDFLVYRNKYTGHEIHIAHPTPQYRLEQEPVLDKIRYEIARTRETEDGFLMHDGTKRAILQIIDKYIAERNKDV